MDVWGTYQDVITVTTYGFASTSGVSALSRGELPDNRLVNGDQALGSNAGFRYWQSSGNLWFDSNGDTSGGLILIATLGNKPTFTAFSNSNPIEVV